MIVQTEKIMIMEKYFIHSNELHLIDVDKIHQAVERIVDSLDMAAGSTCHFDLYKVVETYFKDLDSSLFVRCHEIDRYNPTDGIVRCFTDTGRSLQTGQLSVFSKKSGKYHECVEGVFIGNVMK